MVDVFFDKNNPKHIAKLNKWQSKSNKIDDIYDRAIDCWTNADLKKLEVAKQNNLNYVVLWNKKDIENWIKTNFKN